MPRPKVPPPRGADGVARSRETESPDEVGRAAARSCLLETRARSYLFTCFQYLFSLPHVPALPARRALVAVLPLVDIPLFLSPFACRNSSSFRLLPCPLLCLHCFYREHTLLARERERYVSDLSPIEPLRLRNVHVPSSKFRLCTQRPLSSCLASKSKFSIILPCEYCLPALVPPSTPCPAPEFVFINFKVQVVHLVVRLRRLRRRRETGTARMSDSCVHRQEQLRVEVAAATC